MSAGSAKVTQDLLARAHSPESASRIYNEKIQYRPLHLRPSSPTPGAVNARAARRLTREKAKSLKKQKPKPLSSREKRKLGLYSIPKESQKYEIYQSLNNLWQGYMREILGHEIYSGGSSTAAKLASAEFHGAEVEVVRCNCVDRVGIKGIVIRDRKYVFEVVTKNRGVKTVPKEGTVFRVEVSAPEDATRGSDAQQNDPAQDTEQEKQAERRKTFVFDILGDQMMLRSADRANRKFKGHFLKNL